MAHRRGVPPVVIVSSAELARADGFDDALAHEWDGWLAEQGGEAGFLQTSTWARVNAAINNVDSHLVLLRDGDGQIKAGALVGARRAGGLVGRVRGGAALDCFEGPVVAAGENDAAVERVVETAESLMPRATLTWHGRPASASADAHRALEAVLGPRGYEAAPWATSVVNLDDDEDVLAGRCNPAARKAVRRARRAGLAVVRCMTRDEYVARFLGSYEEANPGRAHPFREAAVWDLDRDDYYRFYIAVDSRGDVHATLGTYRFNGMATEISSSRTPVGVESGLPAQDLLHWEVLLAHRELGDRLFNLAGYAPDPTDAKEHGIKRFKQKWGGRDVTYARFRRSPTRRR
jgi:hypothetical protein